MQYRGLSARACAAFALLFLTAPAQASTPAPIWRDVARVNILCLVRTSGGVDRGRLNDRICESARDMAAIGSPAPVAIIAPGDPAVLAPDSVTLLVHASAQGGPHRLLAFSIRPFRNSAGESQMLFAAAPRAVPLDDSRAGHSKLEAALRAALSETLPWLSVPAGQ